MFDDDPDNPPAPSVASSTGVERDIRSEPDVPAPTAVTPDHAPEPDVAVPTAVAPELSPAETRFKACRWHAKEDGDNGREYCSHRDVLPYAGKGGFAAEAWCPDCAMYKLRRSPKKRVPVDDNYGY
jgi:hypothetical protein